MKHEIAALSEAGPRSVNEDGLAFWTTPQGYLVCAIADGLGGMGGGEQASSMALSIFREVLEEADIDSVSLRRAAEAAHRGIKDAQEKSPAVSRMATTLTAAIISDNQMSGIHCGDTRVAIARGHGIKKLTRDHSEGERLFRAGKITKDELMDYPRKNILESALGIDGAPLIEEFRFDVLPGDKIVFTTDGVHGKIPLREMKSIAEHHSHAMPFIQDVRDSVMSKIPDDNFSAIAVFLS